MKQHARMLALGTAVLVGAEPAAAATMDAFAPQELGSLSSVAAIEDASALAINPAALAFQRGGHLFLSRSVNGLEQTNLFLTGGGFGSAWQQYRAGGRFLNDFTLGTGIEGPGGLALGGTFSYLQFLDSQGGNSANFGLSAIYRPNPWFSTGLTVNNLTKPPVGGTATLDRFYRGGVAIRPGTDRLTISLDAGWREGTPIDQVTPWLGVQAQPIPGFVVRGLVDNQLQYSLGLGMQFGQLSTGFMSGMSHGRVGASDVAYFATSDLTERNALNLGFDRLAYIRLEGTLADEPINAFDIRQDYYPGVLHLTKRIEQAKADPRINGVVLDIRGLSTGLATIQELRDAITDFRASGKTAIAYVYTADVAEYYLATSCEKIVVHPAGTIAVRGLAATVPFFKGFFDKIGVKPQFVAIGKYKSAPEQFTRRSFTEPAEEQTRELLNAQFGQLVDGIAKARRLTKEEVTTLIDKGMFSPPLAKERGLVDAVAYPDEVPGLFEKGPALTYPLAVHKPATWGAPDVLAVVHINGTITRGESAGDLINGVTSGSATVTRALRDIRDNDQVKAVVIRVDSPGGDAVASDEIGREIDLVRESGKPVIISMGDVAASGGYWVAANGTRIYAEPGTITGSIGVFTGSFVFSDLLKKLDITTQTLKRGEHADMESGVRPLTEAELTMLRENARYTYVQFLERVAQGRKIATSRVDELAQGRVWAGSKAEEVGLIDKVGGLEVAIEDARAAAEMEPTTTVLEFYPKPGAVWETFDDSNMDAQIKRTLRAAETLSRTQSWLLMPPVTE